MFKLEAVSYTYGDANSIKALEDISFELKKGSFTGIAGPVGSGKTTLAILLSGLFKPSTGIIRFDNKIIGKDIKQHELWQKIGFVQQQSEDQIFESSVESEVAFALKNAAIDPKKFDEIINSSLRLIGLNQNFKKRSPFKLSGGEKRLVAISSIIAYNPEILIFDEPTYGLDGVSKKSVINYIKSVKGKKTIILITHNPDELLLCDDLLLLDSGRLLAKGKTQFVIKDNFPKLGLHLPSKWQLFDILKKCGINVENNFSMSDLIKLAEEKYGPD